MSDSKRTVSLPPHGRLAGIDYGSVRIGVCVCDPDRILASPLETYTRRNEDADAAYFRRLIDEERIVGFVIGLPVHASGDESEKSREVRRFGAWLTSVTERPIDYWDERYTTREAGQLLNMADMRGKKRKARLDQIAAQIILASYLEANHSTERTTGALEDEPEAPTN